MVPEKALSAEAPTLGLSVTFFILYAAMTPFHAYKLFSQRNNRVHAYLMSFSFLRAAAFALYAAWSEMRTSSTLALTSKAVMQGSMFLLVESVFVLLCAWISHLSDTPRPDENVGTGTNDTSVEPVLTISTSSSSTNTTQNLIGTGVSKRRPDALLLRASQFTTLSLSVLGVIGSVKYYGSESSDDVKLGLDLRKASDIGFIAVIVACVLITTWCVRRIFDDILYQRETRQCLRAAILYFCAAALVVEEVTKVVDLFVSPDDSANVHHWPHYTLLFIPELAILVLLLAVNVSELFYEKERVRRNSCVF